MAFNSANMFIEEGEDSFFKVKIIINHSTSFLEAIYKFMKIRYVIIKTFPQQDLLLSFTKDLRENRIGWEIKFGDKFSSSKIDK